MRQMEDTEQRSS